MGLYSVIFHIVALPIPLISDRIEIYYHSFTIVLSLLVFDLLSISYTKLFIRSLFNFRVQNYTSI